MKKSVKLLSLSLLGLVALTACGGDNDATGGTTEIAMITDIGNIDDHSFNQSTWEGVEKFAKEANVKYNYYRPSEDSDDARTAMIEKSIKDGAKVVVLPGFLFETSVYTAQTKHPDVKFLLLDGEPHTADYATYETKTNTTNILYKEHEPGYLAGYAAVMEGYTKVGFLGGMAVPAVQRYGFGFVQGANAAAKEKYEADKNFKLEIKYDYTGGFVANDTVQSTASGWYSSGTETIFACGGKLYQSVLAALPSNGKQTMIGVDTDQALDSQRIITSAMKELNFSVYSTLKDLYGQVTEGKTVADVGWNSAYAGKTRNLGAAEGMVGLAHSKSSWRLKNFTVEQYEALFNKVKNGEIAISDKTPTDEEPNYFPTVESYVTVSK